MPFDSNYILHTFFPKRINNINSISVASSLCKS